MKMKLLNLQVVPWCLHLLGNPISCLQLHQQSDHDDDDDHRHQRLCRRSRTVKIVTSDGSVKVYHKPIHVSDLMSQFPKHLVCKSDSFYIGQKIPALSESDQLQLGQKYFLLPQHCFQSVLSFVTIASLLASDSPQQQNDQKKLLLPSSRNAFLRKAATCQPFDIQKGPSGCLKIRVSDDFISMLMEEKKSSSTKEKDEGEVKGEVLSSESRSRVCTTPQLRKDYTQLVGTRPWKPKLDTIKEKSEKRRKLSSFGIKRRKKAHIHHHHHHHQPKSTVKTTQRSNSSFPSSASDNLHHKSSSSRSKIRFRSRK